MAKQSFDGWQTAEVEFGDFPPPGAGDAGGEPDGTGNLGGEGESDRSDWDRFFAYCDRVIVAALAPANPASRSGGLPPGDLGRAPGHANVAVSRRQPGRLVGDARPQQGDRHDPRARRHAVGLTIEATERAVVDPAGLCPADEPGSVVWQALSELERLIEQRSYAVFFLRWFERMSFGQIAGALSLTPEQARAASPHESEVPSDRREASRSRPGQGMIDDSPPRPRGNVRSRRSGRSMDLAGDQHQDQSGGREFCRPRHAATLVLRRTVTCGRTRRCPPRERLLEEARGIKTRREASQIPANSIQRDHAGRGPIWPGEHAQRYLEKSFGIRVTNGASLR